MYLSWRDNDANTGGTELRRDTPISGLTEDFTGTVYLRAIAPSGALSCSVQMYVTAGTGKVEYALPTFRDLTVLGLA